MKIHCQDCPVTVSSSITPDELHNLGSTLEYEALQNPGRPLRTDPLYVAWALMTAARQLKEAG